MRLSMGAVITISDPVERRLIVLASAIGRGHYFGLPSSAHTEQSPQELRVLRSRMGDVGLILAER